MNCSDELASKLDRFCIPVDVEQVAVITSGSWNANTGVCTLFERAGEHWKRTGVAKRVVLGRNGLGWGLGLHAGVGDGPLKVEGDGRSPAGAFELGTAFGYSPSPPDGMLMPYRSAGKNDFFVDDPRAPDYNRWVNLTGDENPDEHWSSFERMRRPDGLYELGIVVLHNSDPVVNGRGSAIFIHLWRSPGAATAGCTALSKKSMLYLLKWLDPDRKPLLIQLPEEEVDHFSLCTPGSSLH